MREAVGVEVAVAELLGVEVCNRKGVNVDIAVDDVDGPGDTDRVAVCVIDMVRDGEGVFVRDTVLLGVPLCVALDDPPVGVMLGVRVTVWEGVPVCVDDGMPVCVELAVPVCEEICVLVPVVGLGLPDSVDRVRMQLLELSAMNRVPAADTVIPMGRFKVALVAGPPSPLCACKPVPAMVAMLPTTLMRRTRFAAFSTTKRFLAASKTTANGPMRLALIARPPSPPIPPPAMVLMTPEVATLRMRLFDLSAIIMAPEEASTVMPVGPFRVADVAGPPSPL